MIDTHAHIDAEDFASDLPNVLDRAFASGLEYIIIPAIEPKRYDNLFKVADSDSRIYCGMGVHPHNAKEVDNHILKVVYDTAKSNDKVKAIGEIGLDYYYDFAPPDVQKKALREQLEIAKDLNLPVIIHNRDSDEDLIKIIQEAQDGNLKGVFHCFYGDVEFLKQVLDLNFNVSFTGNITFKKFDAQETILQVPDDRYMIETDSPYMTPVPYRGKRNEPSYVKYVAEKISEIKNIEIEEVIRMTTENAKKFFSILSLGCLILLGNINLNAQIDDEVYEDEGQYYNKLIGIGPVLGTNTIVESFTPRPNNVSYEGIIAYGGTVHFGIFDYLIIGGTYLYSKNTKLQEDFDDLEPNIHQQIELTANFIVNPYSRINLYGFVGPSFLLNRYGVPGNLGGGSEDKNSLGLNTGLGFYFNLPINGAGVLTFSAEWKLNFMFQKQNFEYDSRERPESPRRNDPVEVSTFFSIPRMNILFYPSF
ncbi:MAG: TatD family hydrolase [Candidatus Kapabacteria bacterium]|nr:TatD family hydrolase [Ignavibacteriota bacterium]MCW5884408.1 TatD family hydrolase [Candidatus Kapabacteria bacterium]